MGLGPSARARRRYLLTTRRSDKFDDNIAASARGLFCLSALRIRDSDCNHKWQEAKTVAAAVRIGAFSFIRPAAACDAPRAVRPACLTSDPTEMRAVLRLSDSRKLQCAQRPRSSSQHRRAISLSR